LKNEPAAPRQPAVDPKVRADKDNQTSLNLEPAAPRAEPVIFASRREPSNLAAKSVQPAADENWGGPMSISEWWMGKKFGGGG